MPCLTHRCLRPIRFLADYMYLQFILRMRMPLPFCSACWHCNLIALAIDESERRDDTRAR